MKIFVIAALVLNVFASHVPVERTVLLVSQATGNLSDFAEVTMRINSAYAKRHGYGFVVARGESSDWVNDRNVRWSKVKILLDISRNALFMHQVGAESEGGRAMFDELVPPPPTCKRCERLLVFIDADAAISNFERKFDWDALVRETEMPRVAEVGGGAKEDPDLGATRLMLMCKEGDGGSLANTGVIVLRDTPEAAELLDRWWAIGPLNPMTLHQMRHEQSAFDFLLSQYPEVGKRVGIAPVGEFNTAPPFYKTHTASSFVLHMMYEPYGGLRKRVFAELEACIAVEGTLSDACVRTLVAQLPALADAAYAAAMHGENRDEDLAVMYAQFLWTHYGRSRGLDALDLYAKAVEFAPHDPDTHRILAHRTIEILGERDEQGGSRWCAVIASLESALALEINPTRLPRVSATLEMARSRCAASVPPAHAEEVVDRYNSSMLAGGVLILLATLAFLRFSPRG